MVFCPISKTEKYIIMNHSTDTMQQLEPTSLYPNKLHDSKCGLEQQSTPLFKSPNSLGCVH